MKEDYLSNKKPNEEIEEDLGSYYKKGGIWYERVIGPGGDIPLIIVGPRGGTYFPGRIGPTREESLKIQNEILNKQLKRSAEKLEKLLEEKK